MSKRRTRGKPGQRDDPTTLGERTNLIVRLFAMFRAAKQTEESGAQRLAESAAEHAEIHPERESTWQPRPPRRGP
jgi:hypothetical protein